MTCQVRGVVHSTALRTIPGADQGVGHHKRHIVLVGPSATLNGNRDMSQWNRVIANANLRSGESACAQLGCFAVERVVQLAQMTLRQIDQLLVVHSASGGQNNTIRLVVAAHVVLQIRLSDRLDVLCGSQNRLAQWSSLESSGVQMVEHDFLQIGLHFLHLAQNNSALAFNFSLTQLRILNDVGEDFHRLRHILGQTLGVEHRLLPGRVGVQVGAQILNLEFEVGLRPLVRSLEGHVLQEVGNTIGGGSLVPRSGIDPETDRCGRGARVLRGHTQTIVQSGGERGRDVLDGGLEVGSVRRLEALRKGNNK